MTTPPAVESTLRFRASDGYELEGTLFEVPSPKAAVVIASAMGVPRGVYAKFARFLGEAGIATITFDYRGIGGSAPAKLRGFKASLIDWAEKDIPAAQLALTEKAPGVPLLYFAHSIGGQLFGFQNESPIRAALTVASQSGQWRLWTGWKRVAMWSLWHLVIPTIVPLAGRLPMRALGQGEDLPAGAALEWARWGRNPDYLQLGVKERGAQGFSRFRGTLRAYAISDDGYAPVASVEALFQMYSGAQKELRVVTPRELGEESIGHFGCFTARFRNSLWTEWREWLLEQGRSSRAA